MRSAAAAALLACVAGCKTPEPRVGNARLPEADLVIEAPDGPTFEVPGPPPAGPLQGPVRIAADRDARHEAVLAAARAVRDAGGEPFFLVAKRDRIVALEPFGAGLAGDYIQLYATAADGKVCVSRPGVAEAKCAQRLDVAHVDRSSVRQLVREAVKGYGFDRVLIVADAELGWADVVRALDGARTCCGKEQRVEAALMPLR